jgi:hypothetical protein
VIFDIHLQGDFLPAEDKTKLNKERNIESLLSGDNFLSILDKYLSQKMMVFVEDIFQRVISIQM